MVTLSLETLEIHVLLDMKIFVLIKLNRHWYLFFIIWIMNMEFQIWRKVYIKAFVCQSQCNIFATRMTLKSTWTYYWKEGLCSVY